MVARETSRIRREVNPVPDKGENNPLSEVRDMKTITACEVVSRFIGSYEREYAENIKLADEAWNVYRVTSKFEDKLHYDHMFMDMLTAHGKIKAAKEILNTLTETSNENR